MVILLGVNAVILAVIASLMMLSTFTVQETVPKAGITKWEYKVDSVKDLEWSSTGNRLGRDGWEIISARRARDSFDNFSYECIMKRPLRY